MKFFLLISFVFLLTAAAVSGNDCPMFCTRHMAPLCAKDNIGSIRQFSNECTMKMENCQFAQSFKKVHDGSC